MWGRELPILAFLAGRACGGWEGGGGIISLCVSQPFLGSQGYIGLDGDNKSMRRALRLVG